MRGKLRLVPHGDDGDAAGVFGVDCAGRRVACARKVACRLNQLGGQVLRRGRDGRGVEVADQPLHAVCGQVVHRNGRAHFGQCFGVFHPSPVVYQLGEREALDGQGAARQGLVDLDLVCEQLFHFARAPGRAFRIHR